MKISFAKILKVSKTIQELRIQILVVAEIYFVYIVDLLMLVNLPQNFVSCALSSFAHSSFRSVINKSLLLNLKTVYNPFRNVRITFSCAQPNCAQTNCAQTNCARPNCARLDCSRPGLNVYNWLQTSPQVRIAKMEKW